MIPPTPPPTLTQALGTHRLASLGPELQDFCGRDKEVEEIKELLTTHVAVNIHGSPGMCVFLCCMDDGFFVSCVWWGNVLHVMLYTTIV